MIIELIRNKLSSIYNCMCAAWTLSQFISEIFLRRISNTDEDKFAELKEEFWETFDLYRKCIVLIYVEFIMEFIIGEFLLDLTKNIPWRITKYQELD